MFPRAFSMAVAIAVLFAGASAHAGLVMERFVRGDFHFLVDGTREFKVDDIVIPSTMLIWTKQGKIADMCDSLWDGGGDGNLLFPGVWPVGKSRSGQSSCVYRVMLSRLNQEAIYGYVKWGSVQELDPALAISEAENVRDGVILHLLVSTEALNRIRTNVVRDGELRGQLQDLAIQFGAFNTDAVGLAEVQEAQNRVATEHEARIAELEQTAFISADNLADVEYIVGTYEGRITEIESTISWWRSSGTQIFGVLLLLILIAIILSPLLPRRDIRKIGQRVDNIAGSVADLEDAVSFRVHTDNATGLSGELFWVRFLPQDHSSLAGKETPFKIVETRPRRKGPGNAYRLLVPKHGDETGMHMKWFEGPKEVRAYCNNSATAKRVLAMYEEK